MAASNTGGWVRRVGAAGGGRTYRRRRPINFYGVLVLVAVLGFSSVAFARYQYTHHAVTPSVVPPTVGQSPAWFAALGLDVCGKQQPPLAANPTAASSGFQAIEGGAIEIEPTNSSQAGENATLAKFVAAYKGLTVSSALIAIPNAKGVDTTSKTFVAGATCPKGTPDAGLKGAIEIATWASSDTKAKISTSAASVRFASNQLITIAFVPKGSIPSQPPAKAIAAMFNGPQTTSTTTSSSTTTTTRPVTPTSKG